MFLLGDVWGTVYLPEGKALPRILEILEKLGEQVYDDIWGINCIHGGMSPLKAGRSKWIHPHQITTQRVHGI